MGFHSDSEAGVQRTIASLSLGSPAGMRFRRVSNGRVRRRAGTRRLSSSWNSIMYVTGLTNLFIAFAFGSLMCCTG